MRSDFEQLIVLWEDGQRRIAALSGSQRRAYEDVVDAVVLELRRRLGGKFTTEELAAYFLSEGTDWCFEVAYKAAPGRPDMWDVATVGGAAFARYARSASDFGGGQRYYEE
ncbi:MAG: hypothetical protein ACP5H2_07895 [Solirubrobacteraceae bacterium]